MCNGFNILFIFFNSYLINERLIILRQASKRIKEFSFQILFFFFSILLRFEAMSRSELLPKTKTRSLIIFKYTNSFHRSIIS
jgi:hypothetical protein